jgi:TatD DNase family protein
MAKLSLLLALDAHTHLDQHDEAELPEMLQRAAAARVGAIVIAGTTLESSRRAISLAEAEPRLFAAVGVHPQDLKAQFTDRDVDALHQMAGNQLVVAISEIGLDYQAESPGHNIQVEAFRAQIQVARSSRLPVIWHMREATADCLRILREEGVGEIGGAAHYFQGTWDEAVQVLDLCCAISLAKPLLRVPELQSVARRLPIDSIVLETDSYPQPFKRNRDKWTEPKDVTLVAGALAEIRGMTVEEVIDATSRNALSILGERANLVREMLDSAGSGTANTI